MQSEKEMKMNKRNNIVRGRIDHYRDSVEDWKALIQTNAETPYEASLHLGSLIYPI